VPLQLVPGDAARKEELRDQVVRLELLVRAVGRGAPPAPGLAKDRLRNAARDAGGHEHEGELISLEPGRESAFSSGCRIFASAAGQGRQQAMDDSCSTS